MQFQLRSLHESDPETFTTRQLLELLGDPINDEIQIKGKSYRISSIEELDGGGSSGPTVFETIEWVVDAHTSNIFNIGDNNPFSNATLLTVNGIVYRYGHDKDYHLEFSDLYWHGPVDLGIGDIVVFRYLKTQA